MSPQRLCRILTAVGITVGATPAAAQNLETVIAEALAHSPALEAARARLDSGNAQIDQAKAERNPSLVIDGDIGVGRINPQGYFGLSAQNVTPKSARATVEMPLFDGGRIRSGIHQAKNSAALAEQQLVIATSELRVNVVEAYVRAVTARQMVARYETLSRALDETIRSARLKFKAGEGTSTETFQAEGRRAESESGLAAARGQLAVALAQLTSLTGHPVDVDTRLPPAPSVPASPDEAAAMALRDNPALTAALRLADLARAKTDGARASRLPTIGAYAEAASVRDKFFPGYKSDSAAIGVRARWTIFSGGRLEARAAGAYADLRAAEADVRSTRMAVQQQAIVAFADVMTARSVMAASEARVISANAALHGAALEVQSGVKPLLSELDAEREAIDAEAGRANASGQNLIAIYRLRAIAGED